MPLHIQPGKEQRVAVVFSCPGRHEEIAGHPAAKATGKNLEALLSLLAGALNRSDLSRDNITVTNAWPEVEYKAKTGRSEATNREVLAPANIRRLQGELDAISDLVIFCGAKARAVSRRLQLRHRPKYLYLGHLGLRGLSSLKTDVEGEPILSADLQIGAGRKMSKQRMRAENTEKRLAVLVDSILTQLGQQTEAAEAGKGKRLADFGAKQKKVR